MIDWGTAAALLAAIDRRRGRRRDIAAEMARECRDSPRFQNIDFPLSPFPVVLAASELDGHTATAERYVALLERVLDLYRESAEVRAFFQLTPEQERLVLLESGLRPRIRIARLDGYLDPQDDRVRFLENNSDCPAGTLFSERINRMVDRVLAPAVEEIGRQVIEMPLDRTDAARQQLLAAYRDWGGSKSEPTLAILQIKGRANLESLEMAEEFSARGTPTFVVDPREVEVGADGVRIEGRLADVIWNKVNTVYWNQLAAETPGLLASWEAAVASGKVCHCNPFAARYITESKLCAAFLQEPEFASAFEPDDRGFLAHVLPWSRKLAPGKKVEYQGESRDLADLILSRQSDFVVKQAYDIRGDGVTIGRSTRREDWEAVVAQGLREGFVAQEFIPGRTYPVLMDAAATRVVPMTASLDSFMFGGKLVGHGSKGGLGTKVNVFQGGQKLAVRAYRSKNGV